jgi:hypothetical protein
MDVEGLALLQIQTVKPGLGYGAWIGLITRVRV